MPYTSIIFDLDGTLLDTLADIATTSNAVLARYGFPLHPQEKYRNFVGDGLTTLIERITPEGTGRQMIEECCALFNQLYAKNWKNTCTPYAGVSELLHRLREKSFNLAVLSNKPHAFATIFVDEYFPGDIFSLVYGQRNGFAKKPDPGVALEIAEKLGSRPADTVFVGDTGVDIRTGKAAGMLTVGVTWGFRSVSELREHRADIIINSPMELLQYVVSVP
jgi:phosphoglycolate phosphatase